MTYDRTRDRSRHTEYSRPQHTSRRNENRETRDMSETRHRYNRTRSPRNEYIDKHVMSVNPVTDIVKHMSTTTTDLFVEPSTTMNHNRRIL